MGYGGGIVDQFNNSKVVNNANNDLIFLKKQNRWCRLLKTWGYILNF